MGISNKIIILVFGILFIFTVLLSYFVGLTSFNNLSDVTRKDLGNMSTIFAEQISDMEKEAVNVAKSFEENVRISDQVRLMAEMGPYYPFDNSEYQREMEEAEMIYLFKAQVALIPHFKSLINLNRLSKISFYLVPPFATGSVKEKSSLALSMDKKSIYITQFGVKGDAEVKVIHQISVKEFIPPDKDDFDVSSVYALSVDHFIKENLFTIFTGISADEYLDSNSIQVSDKPESSIITTSENIKIRVWCPVKVLLRDPDTFVNKKYTVGSVVIDKLIDKNVMGFLAEKLGTDVGIAREGELIISSLTDNKRFKFKGKNLVESGMERYLASISKIKFENSHVKDLNSVTFYPVSKLHKMTQDLFFKIFITAVFVMIFSGLMIYFFVHFFIKIPLDKLMYGVKQISTEADCTQVDIDSKDELGKLSKVFNKMSLDLKTKNSAIEKIVAALDRTTTRVTSIINSMTSVIISVDTEFKVMEINKEAEKVTGFSGDEAVGVSVGEILPMMGKYMDDLSHTLHNGLPVKKAKIVRKKDKTTEYYNMEIMPLISRDIDGAVISITDVTESVRLEEMMIQSEKMLSVGGLAAGMAHEINNPLAGIMQNAQVVRNRLSKDLPVNRKEAEECGTTLEVIQNYMEQRGIFRMINTILEAGGRAAEIVENMLSFARQSTSGFLKSNIASLLDKTVELAASDYDLKKKYDFRNIKIEREYDSDLPEVPCEPGKIQQVFLNILTNGAQAMAANESYGQAFILRIKKTGENARVEIEDNGPGMDEETAKKVFEPFFTTKKVGVGTGLGLSVSYFIITENHQGTMSVKSSPGMGTKFVIDLPLE
ncbi:MAG: ATP-binding protein [Thermodesulfobacteriota bacterium]|nr:ATP-binding protein [Thermodesulfobacteriota bacterium]